MRPVDSDTPDRSRNGGLVHDAKSSGRHLTVTAYIEGLQGDSNRRAVESNVTCRTQEQGAEIARVLREARYPCLPPSATAEADGDRLLAAVRRARVIWSDCQHVERPNICADCFARGDVEIMYAMPGQRPPLFAASPRKG